MSDLKKYELTVVYPPSGSQGSDTLPGLVTKLMKKLKIGLLKEDVMGDMDFAHPLKKFDRGLFHYYDLEMTPDLAVKLKDELRLEKGILRWLLVLADDESGSEDIASDN